jgi:hypothetical protein
MGARARHVGRGKHGGTIVGAWREDVNLLVGRPGSSSASKEAVEGRGRRRRTGDQTAMGAAIGCGMAM